MRSLFFSPLFLVGLLLRFVLIPFFGSHYMKDLFVPFIDTAVTHVGANPWTLLPPNYFPYGSFLFISLFIPKYLGYQLLGVNALGSGVIGLTLMKIPLLVFDFLLLVVLMKAAKRRASSLLWLYWLNPIVLYISYIHGQLDVAAMCFCVLSLVLLTDRSVARSAMAMVLATLCKFHVVVIIPFVLVYIWNKQFAREAVRSITKWVAIWGSISLIGFFPLLEAGRLSYASAASPEAFRLFSARVDFGSGQVIYFGVLVVLAVLGRLCVSARITDRGLIFGSGAVFGALLLGTSTMPGWYYWVLPFFSLFFALYLNVPALLFWVFNGLYLVYFGLHEVAAVDPLTKGVIYTLLQTSLAGIVIAMWKLAISRDAVLQGRAKPVVLGLAGNSGTGKNYLSAVFQDIFNPENSVVIEGDDYHKWERNHERWREYTHLNPRANDLRTMEGHALSLLKGTTVMHSQYDHDTGVFTAPREIKPNKTVILQGLHTLYLRGMRSKLDLKIFLAPHESIRTRWKVNRDVKERGHSLEKVLQSIEDRAVDARLHIDPQRNFADLVIEYTPQENLSHDEVVKGEFELENASYTMWNDAPVSDVVDALRESGECQVQFETLTSDIDRTVLKVKGTPSVSAIQAIADKVFPNLRHITRGWNAPKWRAGLDGITQLITVSLLGGRIFDETPA